MKKYMVFWVISLMCSVFLSILFAGGCGGEGDITRTRPFVMVFFENGWSEMHGSSLPSLQENQEIIDTVSPFWFTVNMDGSIEDNHNREAMNFARENNIPVIALFNNEKDVVSGNDAMLQDPEVKEKSLEAILEMVEKYDYDGINIDFEIMPPESRDLMTDYIRELAEAPEMEGKKLDVSVFPRQGVDEEMHGVYDFSALGEVADRIVLMTYNEHYPASNPGPIASLDWVEQNIQDALQDVPREKLILGIAVYGYDWPGAKAGSPETVEYIPMTEAVERAERKDAEIDWDDEARSPFYRYKDNGLQREVWFENARAIEPKLDLALEYDLPGIAIWRIGFEDEEVWNAIESRLGSY